MNSAIITWLFLILTENVLFSSLLGLPSFTDQGGKKYVNLLTPAFFVMAFSVLGSMILYPVTKLFRFENGKVFYPLILILIIALLAAAMMLAAVLLPEKYRTAVRMAIWEAAISSAMIGILYFTIDASPSVTAAAAKGLMYGCSFLFASCFLQIAVPYIFSEKMPARFRGWRGLYIYAAVLSMAALCLTN